MDETEVSSESSADTPTRTTAPPETDGRFEVPLGGVEVDEQTRCHHWNDDVDVIAIKFPCCETYYPCFECHEKLTDHEARRWPQERFEESAVLCGVCRTALSIESYLGCGDTCPSCGTAFNPGCRDHHHRYFSSSQT